MSVCLSIILKINFVYFCRELSQQQRRCFYFWNCEIYLLWMRHVSDWMMTWFECERWDFWFNLLLTRLCEYWGWEIACLLCAFKQIICFVAWFLFHYFSFHTAVHTFSKEKNMILMAIPFHFTLCWYKFLLQVTLCFQSKRKSFKSYTPVCVLENDARLTRNNL